MVVDVAEAGVMEEFGVGEFEVGMLRVVSGVNGCRGGCVQKKFTGGKFLGFLSSTDKVRKLCRSAQWYFHRLMPGVVTPFSMSTYNRIPFRKFVLASLISHLHRLVSFLFFSFAHDVFLWSALFSFFVLSFYSDTRDNASLVV